MTDRSPTRPRTMRPTLLVLLAGWLAMLLSGLALFWRFGATAGASGEHPAQWPRASAIARSDGVPSLVVFLHPHCSCSRATLVELERVIALAEVKPRVSLVWLKPANADDTWRDTPTMRRAAAIAGIDQRIDESGREARRFGAMTSGQVLLYDPSGGLRYAGGITGARGEVGDNIGRREVLASLAGRTPMGEPPVYGCPLDEPAAAAATIVAGEASAP